MVIAERSYVIKTPQSIVHQNRRHLRLTTNPNRVEKFAELEPDVEPEQDLSPKSATADLQELPQTVTQCKVPLVTQPHANSKSSHGTLTKSSGAEVRTSSSQVVRKSIRF